MSLVADPPRPHGLAAIVGWRRVRFALGFALLVGSLLSLVWAEGWWSITLRTLVLGVLATLAFGVLEQWPKRLPGWLPRWVVQLVGVAVAMPATTFAIWVVSTAPGALPFWAERDRLEGFMVVTALSVLLAPWIALAALVRQKDAFARHQALAFELERS